MYHTIHENRVCEALGLLKARRRHANYRCDAPARKRVTREQFSLVQNWVEVFSMEKNDRKIRVT